MSNYVFRKATKSDLPALEEIFRINSVKQGGYLACEDSKPNENNIDTVYILTDGEVPVAYISYCSGLHPDVDESEIFEGADINPSSSIYIKQVAVHKSHHRSGIGTHMYEKFFDSNPGLSFYCHVNVKNPASQEFHKKVGFKKVGVYKKDNFFGVENYQSDLLKK